MRRAWIAVGLVLIVGCREDTQLTTRVEPQQEQPTTPPEEDPDPIFEPLPEPPEPLDDTPMQGKDGIPAPMPNVYTDKGVADRDQKLRGLLALPIRNRDALVQTIRNLYDPGHPDFRKYLSPAEWNSRHAPAEDDVAIVTDWLRAKGFEVPRVATNRLLIHFRGTVGQFNDTFGVEVHVLERKAPQEGNRPFDVFGLLTELTVPTFVEERIESVVTLDLDVEPGTLPPAGPSSPMPPANVQDGFRPEQIAFAYGYDVLAARGIKGAGQKLGIVLGATFQENDLRAFWQAFNIPRAMPRVVQIMEPPKTRYREANLDTMWAGALAPEAELVLYSGPDSRNTSILYTYNEAIAQGEVSVITTSFAHREDSEPRAIRQQYSESSMMAAALGITVCAASGDSAGVDVPSSSPYVTAVGGTMLGMIDMRFVWEVAWDRSGSGSSLTLAAPDWQRGLPGVGAKRAVVDVSMNAGMGFWYKWLNAWYTNIGTSFSAPLFAAMIANVNQGRALEGKPPVGFLNSLLYTRPDIQATFRDIDEGGTPKYESGPGWDFPTGWGAPNAEGLLRTIP
jgi:kumamolisin